MIMINNTTPPAIHIHGCTTKVELDVEVVVVVSATAFSDCSWADTSKAMQLKTNSSINREIVEIDFFMSEFFSYRLES